MIQRIYIHNYRCFENFDLTIGAGTSSVLVIGKNGSGKSSLIDALRMIQSIARGDNRIRQFLKKEDFAFDRLDVPIRIEITANLDGQKFEYGVAFEFPANFQEPKIKEEFLKADGQNVFTRQEAEVSLAGGSTSFLVDWHVVALPVGQLKGAKNPIERFRSWIAKAVLIAPVPPDIEEESEVDSLEPTERVHNFADWFNGVLSEFPASYSTIDSFLKKIMPDFLNFQNKTVGESTKRIVVRFQKGDKIYKTGLSRLSDGEKMFFVTAVLLAANKHLGPMVCFWDEPDNFVGLSEVGQMTMELRKSFKNSGTGQIFVTSHNPEAIRKFSRPSRLTSPSYLESNNDVISREFRSKNLCRFLRVTECEAAVLPRNLALAPSPNVLLEQLL